MYFLIIVKNKELFHVEKIQDKIPETLVMLPPHSQLVMVHTTLAPLKTVHKVTAIGTATRVTLVADGTGWEVGTQRGCLTENGSKSGSQVGLFHAEASVGLEQEAVVEPPDHCLRSWFQPDAPPGSRRNWGLPADFGISTGSYLTLLTTRTG